MKEPITHEELTRRHVAYPFDIGERPNQLQVGRLREMYSFVPDFSKVLDIGCNSGYIKDYTNRCDCWGVDLCPDLVAKAARKIKAQISAAENLPFTDKFFDAVVLGEILEHVYDDRAVLSEAVRVTRHLIVGSTPHEFGHWGRKSLNPRALHPVETHPHHVRCYDREMLEKLFTPFGTAEIWESPAENPQFYLFKLALYGGKYAKGEC